jgi:hypothetical protein
MYTVYKTVNLVNGKYYIGVHKTDNPYDDYLGSGKLIKAAITKYGVDSFKKEIIAIFEDKDSAYQLENELVVICKESYNLKIGGEGGFDYINSSGLTSSKFNVSLTTDDRSRGGKTTSIKYKTDAEFRAKRSYASTQVLIEKGVTFAGRVHSDEAKHRIGTKNRISQLGANNSQFGTCWITNGTENKKIKRDVLSLYQDDGWYLGRTQKPA